MKFFWHKSPSLVILVDIPVVPQVNSAGQFGSVSQDLSRAETLELWEPNGAHILAKRAIRKKRLRLRWKKIDNFLCSTVGSEDIFAVLFGQQSGEDTFWLDSSSVDQVRSQLTLNQSPI